MKKFLLLFLAVCVFSIYGMDEDKEKQECTCTMDELALCSAQEDPSTVDQVEEKEKQQETPKSNVVAQHITRNWNYVSSVFRSAPLCCKHLFEENFY